MATALAPTTTRAQMRRRRPLLRKGDARERALLEATEALLRAGRPAALTVEAITTRARVTRTAFYFYFASKEDAIGRIAKRYLGEIYSAAGPVFDPAVPLQHGVRSALENQVEVWAEHGQALAAIADLAGTDGGVRELWYGEIERFIDPLAARIAAQQRAGGKRPSKDNRRRAEALVWMLERYYRVWASGRCRHSAREMVDTLHEIALAVIAL